MTTNINIPGDCYNNKNIGCVSSNDCFSSNCTGNGTLTVFVFDDSIETNFPLTQNIELLPIAEYTSSLTPKKIFSLSNSSIDSIYLVDSNLGLLSLQYNTANKTVTTPWNIIIPSNNPGIGTLVDAIVDQNGLIYVIINNGSQDIVYNYDGISFDLFNGGVQLDTSNNPINIQFIDVSLNNDILLLNNNNLYVKSASQTLYTLQTVIVNGSARFYNSTSGTSSSNYCYINSTNEIIFNNITNNLSQATNVNNFNINPSQPIGPNFVISSLQTGATVGGNQNYGAQIDTLFTNLPGRFTTPGALSLVTENGFYILTPNSCF
jgi:hypothetical protein